MPKLQSYRRWSVTGPLHTDDEATYEMVPGTDPVDALLTVHRDALGPRTVRLVEGRFVFTDAADRLFCAGRWRITALAGGGEANDIVIEIPALDPADGRREAA